VREACGRADRSRSRAADSTSNPVWRDGFQLYRLISAIARLQQEGPVDCVTSDAFYTNCAWAILRPKVDAEPMTVRPASRPLASLPRAGYSQ